MVLGNLKISIFYISWKKKKRIVEKKNSENEAKQIINEEITAYLLRNKYRIKSVEDR